LGEHGEIQLSALGQGRHLCRPRLDIEMDIEMDCSEHHMMECLIPHLHHAAAISTVVSIAEILKKDGLALEKSECDIVDKIIAMGCVFHR